MPPQVKEHVTTSHSLTSAKAAILPQFGSPDSQKQEFRTLTRRTSPMLSCFRGRSFVVSRSRRACVFSSGFLEHIFSVCLFLRVLWTYLLQDFQLELQRNQQRRSNSRYVLWKVVKQCRLSHTYCRVILSKGSLGSAVQATWLVHSEMAFRKRPCMQSSHVSKSFRCMAWNALGSLSLPLLL